jgi:hypothetical protein
VQILSVNKKTLISLLTILLSAPLVSVQCTQAKLNSISIVSPIEGVNYSTDTVELKIMATWDFNTALDYLTLTCYIDGEFIKQFPVEKISNHVSINESIQMTKLSIGEHTVKVDATYASYSGIVRLGFEGTENIAKIKFFITDTKIAPLSIYSLDEYKTADIAFNITTNLHNANIFYNIDEKNNQTLQNTFNTYQNSYQYNLTQNDLSEGTHTLNVYAKDTQNNTITTDKTFTVNTNPPIAAPIQLELSLTVLIAVAITVATVISALSVLLIYRKHKPKLPN